jgi:LSD1 subclass zinc finger protein
MNVICPHCRSTLDLPAGLTVTQVQCAICNNLLDVASLQPAPAPAPSQPAPAPAKPRTALIITIIAALAVLCGAVAVFVIVVLPNLQYNDVLNRAKAAESAKKWDEAWELYQRADSMRRGNLDVAEAIARVDANRAALRFESSLRDGLAAEQNKQWQAALTAFQTALAAKPESAEARSAVARVNYQLEMERAQKAEATRDFTTARLAYTEALKHLHNDAAATEGLARANYALAIARAQAAEAAQRWDEADQAFREALRLRPNDPLATQGIARLNAIRAEELYAAAMQRGQQAEAARQWATAQQAYTEALQRKPNDPAATTALQRVNFQLAMMRANEAPNPAAAQAAIQEALRINPHDPAAIALNRRLEEQKLNDAYNQLIQRAAQAERAGDLAGALRLYDEAARLKPGDPIAAEAKRRLAAQTAAAQQAAQYDQAMTRGLQAEQRRDWNGAINAYNDALRVKPNDPTATASIRRILDLQQNDRYSVAMERARQAEQRRDLQSAEAAYKDALRIKPNDPAATAALQRLGDLSRQMDYDSAINNAARAEQARQWSSARNYYNQALAIRPNDPAARQGLRNVDYLEAMDKAVRAEQRNDLRGAEAAYDDALRAKPNDFAAMEGKRRIAAAKVDDKYQDAMDNGRRAENSRNWNGAISAYQEALRIKPRDPAAEMALNNVQYTAAMDRGTRAEQSRNWSAALSAYNEALRYRRNDFAAQEGIRRVQEAQKKK